jgi:formylglycine-generating enzyme required for sulfatase activity
MPVESFPDARSPSGGFDLAGNAWEWTSTLEDGTDIVKLPDGLVNVAIRGGSYRSQRHELATRARWTAPGMDAFSSPTYDRPIGFRCAMDLP